mgnify:CR=1 FL=1
MIHYKISHATIIDIFALRRFFFLFLPSHLVDSENVFRESSWMPCRRSWNFYGLMILIIRIHVYMIMCHSYKCGNNGSSWRIMLHLSLSVSLFLLWMAVVNVCYNNKINDYDNILWFLSLARSLSLAHSFFRSLTVSILCRVLAMSHLWLRTISIIILSMMIEKACNYFPISIWKFCISNLIIDIFYEWTFQ